MSKIVLYIAASIDGYIAMQDGRVEWLNAFQDADYGLEDFMDTINAVVMGSTTYEPMPNLGPWPYGDRSTYVLTSRQLPLHAPSVKLWKDSVEALVAKLRAENTGNVWLVGGGKVIQSFLELSAIDELRIFVMPIILGVGISLWLPSPAIHKVMLGNVTAYPNGVAQLVYKFT